MSLHGAHIGARSTGRALPVHFSKRRYQREGGQMLRMLYALALQAEAPNMAFSSGFILIWLAIVVVSIAGMWMTFQKAGQPGWAAIIPIYNIVVLMRLARKPGWWTLLVFIPLVNFVIIIIVSIEVAKNFGKGAGFGVGLAFLAPIFYGILGFGDAEYQPAA